MQIQTFITIASEDAFDLTVDEAADAILKALHGDEAKDRCSVTVTGTGSVGPPLDMAGPAFVAPPSA